MEHDPQLRARGFYTELEHPLLGRYKIQGIPFKLSKTPAEISRPAPLIGQHTREVLTELLGLSLQDIRDGYADGTFRWGNNVTRGQLCKIVVLAEGWAIDTTGGPHFSDVPPTARHWWLVIKPDDVDVCDVDPGYPVTVTVTTTLPRMVEIWRGDRDWAEALRSGALDMQGCTTAVRRAVRRWFTLSAFAKVSRPLSKTG